MDKIDYRKKYHSLYAPPHDRVQRITIPSLQFAMIDGHGSPEELEYSQEFQNTIAALYGIAYTLKFERKRTGVGPDYTVGPLEGLWWMSDGGTFDADRPSDWRWTLMIMQPEFVTYYEFNAARDKLKVKKPDLVTDTLRLETLDEGEALQIMHIGPYAEEGSTIQLLEDYAAEHGYEFSGKHHEIYLGDPRRSRPEKLKTILRHPITPQPAPTLARVA